MNLLERDLPLSALQTAINQVDVNNGQLVLISGEAGIGKTSLVEHFIAKQRANWRILRGACDSLFTPRPLGPLYDVAFQTQGSLLTTLDSNTNRQSIFIASLNELRIRPTILVIEDIHWADEATLDLLKFLGRRIQQTNTLLILSYRDDEIGIQHPLRLLIGDFVRLGYVHRIQIQALSEAAVRSLASDKDIDPVALHRQTNGNPFFVTEILASGGGIPETVRAAVLARMARLSLIGRATLEAAAVIGTRIEPWLLSEITGAEATASEESISVGMLQIHEEMFSFRHELARQAILEAISPQRKLTLHRLVLAALETSTTADQLLARLAYHAGQANDIQAVLLYAPAAARQAASVNAHREAAAQYELALRFVSNLLLIEQAALLEAYARECNAIDQREKGIVARKQALELWRSVGNLLKQGENLALLAVPYFGQGQTVEAEQVSRQAIEILETLSPSRELAIAYRMQANLRMLARDNTEAIRWGEKSVAIAKSFGDNEIISGALNAIGSAWIFSDYEHGRELLERSLEIALDNGLDMYVANAYTNLGSASGEVYRFELADQYLVKGIEYTGERDLDASRLYMRSWLALTHLHLGRWNSAADCAASVLQYPLNASAISRIMALLAIGRLRSRRGDPRSWDALDQSLALAETTQNLQRIAPVRAARAETAWLAGDRDRTLEEARASYPLALDKKHPWFVGELAYWRWKAGEDISIPTWVALPFALQITGDWRGAASAWKELKCPYEQAQALADGDGKAQLAAFELFEQLGAQPALEHLKQKMRAAGLRGIPRGPRPATSKNAFGLTSREMDVLALLVKGLNNAGIASQLNISARTVEHHISAIFSKMGVQSRSESIVLALQSGLISKK